MEKSTNIIEAILFASGNAVAYSDICDKLAITNRELRKSLDELKEKYGEEGGIQLLEFNKKAQLASNPRYKNEVETVLNPIREKELTRTILECAAIIAYKQPITRTEIEILRGCNSDYAVNALVELKLIEPCGRKDAVGRPVLFPSTATAIFTPATNIVTAKKTRRRVSHKRIARPKRRVVRRQMRMEKRRKAGMRFLISCAD